MDEPDGSPRDRILDAAERRFRRFGVRRTSVEDITSEAGVGKGSLYLHFASKEVLYIAVIDRCIDRFVADATAAMRRQRSAGRRLRTIVEVAARHYGNDELLSSAMLGDADTVGGSLARRAADRQRERIGTLITHALRDGQRAGTIRADLDAPLAAGLLFEAGWAVVRRHLEGGLPVPLEHALDTLNDLVAHGTAAAGAARRGRGIVGG